jgi:dipeptidyl aminopeptidase/acylaminoacyl peptidase
MRRIYPTSDRVGPRHVIGRLPLRRKHGHGDCAWSPHGNSLVVAGEDTANDHRDAVWTIHTNGTGFRRLSATNGMFSAQPVWSSTGRIAFTTLDEDYERPWIVVMDSNGKNLSMLTEFHGQQPAWSPDGRTLAFVRGPRCYAIAKKGRKALVGSDLEERDPHSRRRPRSEPLRLTVNDRGAASATRLRQPREACDASVEITGEQQSRRAIPLLVPSIVSRSPSETLATRRMR